MTAIIIISGSRVTRPRAHRSTLLLSSCASFLRDSLRRDLRLAELSAMELTSRTVEVIHRGLVQLPPDSELVSDADEEVPLNNMSQLKSSDTFIIRLR